MPGSTLGRVLGTAHELESRLEAALGEKGLSLAKLGVLQTLGEARGPLPLGELAEANQCVRSNITQLVDRLEADGLVRRMNDPGDRRIRRAVLTAKGRKLWAAGQRILEAHERKVAKALGAGELAALERTLARLRE